MQNVLLKPFLLCSTRVCRCQPIKIEPTGSFLLVGTVGVGFSAHQLPLAVALNRIRLGYGVQALRQTKYIRFRSYRQILLVLFIFIQTKSLHGLFLYLQKTLN